MGGVQDLVEDIDPLPAVSAGLSSCSCTNDFWRPLVLLTEHFRAVVPINATDDRILCRKTLLIVNHEDILTNYAAEVLEDESVAFERTEAHIEYLLQRNELGILI
jgi:hypothetical protein